MCYRRRGGGYDQLRPGLGTYRIRNRVRRLMNQHKRLRLANVSEAAWRNHCHEKRRNRQQAAQSCQSHV